MEERERSIQEVQDLLTKAGFLVTDAHAIRPSSFDLMARRDAQLLILKVLKNIDAIAPEESKRLQELQRLLGAGLLVIGQTSGGTPLRAGVVYTRYEIPIVALDTLREFLLRGIPPFLVSSPGGIFARVDGARLREIREERQLSLGALASVAGVTRRTIQLYEDGGGAEITIVERIEEYLREPIASPVELFPTEGSSPESAPPAGESRGSTSAGSPPRSKLAPTGDPLRDTVMRRLDIMGWNVVVTVRCPFDSFSHGGPEEPEEILLTSVGTLRTARHRAEILQGLARVIEGRAMFVTRETTGRDTVDGMPLVSVAELMRHRDAGDLLDLLAERGRA
ncbi:MAG: helix-turn-helix domain-containing protein [Thermoplasmata archaeon]|nr:helix-turn-helix domain-containing protein [Thermoplasmata archaeon]